MQEAAESQPNDTAHPKETAPIHPSSLVSERETIQAEVFPSFEVNHLVEPEHVSHYVEGEGAYPVRGEAVLEHIVAVENKPQYEMDETRFHSAASVERQPAREMRPQGHPYAKPRTDHTMTMFWCAMAFGGLTTLLLWFYFNNPKGHPAVAHNNNNPNQVAQPTPPKATPATPPATSPAQKPVASTTPAPKPAKPAAAPPLKVEDIAGLRANVKKNVFVTGKVLAAEESPDGKFRSLKFSTDKNGLILIIPVGRIKEDIRMDTLRQLVGKNVLMHGRLTDAKGVLQLQPDRPADVKEVR